VASSHDKLPLGVTVSSDGLGTSATLLVDLSVYSLTAVLKTAYWFTDRFYLYLHMSQGAATQVNVEIRGKDSNGNGGLIEACQEFGNALIDQAIRQQVLVETCEVRDALVRKAFAEGRHHMDPDALRKDGANFYQHGRIADDPAGIRRTGG
jgi:His-Xaa-Ser system protein HxsD